MKSTHFTNKGWLIALTLCFLLAYNSADAQFGFALGPKAGLAITTFKGADADNIDSRTAFLGGIFMNFQLAPAFSLQPELLLTERGATYTSNNVKSDLSINYFEVPVLLKFRLPLANDVILPHILLGPNFGFKTNVDFTSTDQQTGSNINNDTDNVKGTDIGGLVGAGIDIQTKGNGVFFTLDGRYGFGFSNINDSDENITLKNAGWTFAAGVGFRLGNKDN